MISYWRFFTVIASILILVIGALIGWLVPQPKFVTNLFDSLAAKLPFLEKYRAEAVAVEKVAEKVTTVTTTKVETKTEA
jgi:hypothetical protein